MDAGLNMYQTTSDSASGSFVFPKINTIYIFKNHFIYLADVHFLF